MKKYILLCASALLFTIFSCKEEKKTDVVKENNQMKEVIAIHDEVMPKMSTIGRLAGQLKSKVDTTAQGKEYQKALRDLQEANESMMDWMRELGDNFDSDEIMNGKELSAEKQLILNEEEAKIKIVREKIETSIANAEALLKE